MLVALCGILRWQVKVDIGKGICGMSTERKNAANSL